MRLAALAIILASAVGIVAYDQYDKSTNYTRVDARVSGVNDQCYLEKIERGILTKTRWTSDMVGCEAAELSRRELVLVRRPRLTARRPGVWHGRSR